MDSDKALREELINYLDKQHTHTSLRNAAKDFPEHLMNEKPAGLPYSFWQMLEHIRISQFDMLDFLRNKNYKEMKWPEEYWPGDEQKATKKMWQEAIDMYEKELDELKVILKDDNIDLIEMIPHGSGQNILREVLQIIDHASYHIGEFIIMRRLAGEWKK